MCQRCGEDAAVNMTDSDLVDLNILMVGHRR